MSQAAASSSAVSDARSSVPETAKNLVVFNTLSKSKEHFTPIHPGQVGIYLCGPTVYKPSHIGHMVGPVVFDAVKRYLSYVGYKVTLVINITDVDDKLIAESNARGVTMSALAEEMTADYSRNLAAMEVDTVDHFPKATAHMPEIIDITNKLIEKGFAYVSGGDVYFDVAKDHDYGRLSGRSLESVMGSGGDMGDRKRSVADFALWKSAKSGEPSWQSPWGPGRPGWHIECSAMSHKLLGKTFDIHGGGLDLAFPHHENEIAQSESCNGQLQAKYWMHNGLMQASSEVGKLGGRNTREADGAKPDAGKADEQAAQEAGKMGKSKGASPFREMLKIFDPETIRFFLLSTHYRRPIDFSEERIKEVGKGLQAFYRFFERFERVAGQSFYQTAFAKTRAEGDARVASHPLAAEALQQRSRFLECMDDDFNSGGAVAPLFDLLRTLNRFVDERKLELPAANKEDVAALLEATSVFRELAALLGLFRTPRKASQSADDGLVDVLMNLIIELRANARKNKDFATSDRIRDALKGAGVTLEDRAGGVTGWSRA